MEGRLDSVLLATALVDKPAWQIGLGVGTAIISGIVGFEYAQFRSRDDSRETGAQPPATPLPSDQNTQIGDGVHALNRPTASVTGSKHTTIDQSQTQITHQHRQTITITSPEARPSTRPGGIDRHLEELGIGGAVVVVVIVGYLVNAAFANVANLYVDARSRALLVLLLLASVTTGLAVGAWLGLRRHTRLDRSWRKPLLAGAVASSMTYVTIWLLSHPLLRIGTLQDILRPFEENHGHILRIANEDRDATTLLAFQSLGVGLAAVTCVITFLAIVLVWSNVEAQLPHRSWFVFAAIHWAFRRVPADRLLIALPVLAIGAALFSSGLWNWIPGHSFEPERPRLGRLTARMNASEAHVSVRVDKPVVLRAEVRRLHRGGKPGIPLGRQSGTVGPRVFAG